MSKISSDAPSQGQEHPTVETYFGSAAEPWSRAMNALHEFARASRCPPGYDVVKWFDTKLAQFQSAVSQSHEASRRDARNGSSPPTSAEPSK